MSARLRPRSGFGSVQASVQSETISATASPNCLLMSCSIFYAALILSRIVQKSANRLILVASLFDHQSRHCHQMRNVGIGVPFHVWARCSRWA